MSLRERLKHFRFVRKLVYAIVGVVSYPGLTIVNRLKISGTEHLRRLPKGNVLFVSNHQTYFADVITFLHIFCAVKWRKKDRLGLPYYLLNPFYECILCGGGRDDAGYMGEQAVHRGRCADGPPNLEPEQYGSTKGARSVGYA